MLGPLNNRQINFRSDVSKSGDEDKVEKTKNHDRKVDVNVRVNELAKSYSDGSISFNEVQRNLNSLGVQTQISDQNGVLTIETKNLNRSYTFKYTKPNQPETKNQKRMIYDDGSTKTWETDRGSIRTESKYSYNDAKTSSERKEGTTNYADGSVESVVKKIVIDGKEYTKIEDYFDDENHTKKADYIVDENNVILDGYIYNNTKTMKWEMTPELKQKLSDAGYNVPEIPQEYKSSEQTEGNVQIQAKTEEKQKDEQIDRDEANKKYTDNMSASWQEKESGGSVNIEPKKELPPGIPSTATEVDNGVYEIEGYDKLNNRNVIAEFKKNPDNNQIETRVFYIDQTGKEVELKETPECLKQFLPEDSQLTREFKQNNTSENNEIPDITANVPKNFNFSDIDSDKDELMSMMSKIKGLVKPELWDAVLNNLQNVGQTPTDNNNKQEPEAENNKPNFNFSSINSFDNPLLKNDEEDITVPLRPKGDDTPAAPKYNQATVTGEQSNRQLSFTEFVKNHPEIPTHARLDAYNGYLGANTNKPVQNNDKNTVDDSAQINYTGPERRDDKSLVWTDKNKTGSDTTQDFLNGRKRTVEQDSEGNVISVTDEYADGSVDVYKPGENGDLERVKSYKMKDDDSSNAGLKRTVGTNETITIKDAEGNVLSTITEHYKFDDNGDKYIDGMSFNRDDNGNVTAYTQYLRDDDGNYIGTKTYEFDDNQNMIETYRDVNGDETTKVLDTNGRDITGTYNFETGKSDDKDARLDMNKMKEDGTGNFFTGIEAQNALRDLQNGAGLDSVIRKDYSVNNSNDGFNSRWVNGMNDFLSGRNNYYDSFYGLNESIYGSDDDKGGGGQERSVETNSDDYTDDFNPYKK